MEPAVRLDPRAEPLRAHAPAQAVTSRGRLWLDRAAGLVVRGGGILVVASLIAILVFLVIETSPILRGARVAPLGAVATPEGNAGALVVEPRLSHLAQASADGHVRVYDLESGGLALDLPPGAPGLSTVAAGEAGFATLGADAHVRVQPVDWSVTYGEGGRKVVPRAGTPTDLALEVDAARVRALTARTAPEQVTAVAALDDGSLVEVRNAKSANAFSGEVSESSARFTLPGNEELSQLVLDPEQKMLYGASARGRVFAWELGSDGIHGPDVADTGTPVTALALLVGGRSLVAGHSDGTLSVWFRLREGRARTELVRAHQFDSQGGAIRALGPSGRGRSFFALGADGALGLYHSTSERVLWRGDSGVRDGAALAFSARGDRAFLARPGEIRELSVSSLHPEISLSSLFGRVWYEDYPEPAFVWQSTGGTEEAEPKLSLTPLWFGTLKGTFYALFFAIPLGVLAALYTSQVMDPRLQRIVKPAVEIMASLPSVVLGFLAGLWLAPRLEHVFPGFIATVCVAPLLALAAGAAYAALPGQITRRFPVGTEVAVSAVALFGGGWLCFHFSPALERAFFGGDFASWLHASTGATYDPRNAIVAGVAMAFAVIPIVFAIAEESLSNVPRTLSAASLALGATRWQTIARVVLPAASPGLFAAVMIGFGRAVGETMIVLMATGNTPLIDGSPFDGFRSLSANIAVEIPEAPQGATLYRVLFLSALLLFIVTFAANGFADIVRERLRRRYSGAR